MGLASFTLRLLYSPVMNFTDPPHNEAEWALVPFWELIK
jgi:hypothetical protein